MGDKVEAALHGHLFRPDGATDLRGLALVSSRAVPDGQMLLADGVVYVGEHDDRDAAVIAAELVACTLGARIRPELQMDHRAVIAQRIGDALKGGEAACRIAGQRIAQAFANLSASNLPDTSYATRLSQRGIDEMRARLDAERRV